MTVVHAIIACSYEKVGDCTYFEQFSNYMTNPSNQKAIMDYLRSADLSGINWINDRPQSELYILAKSSCCDFLTKFLAHIYDANRSKVVATYQFSTFLNNYHWYLEDIENMKAEFIQMQNMTKCWCKLKGYKALIS